MPRNLKREMVEPAFKNEAEAADWYASAEGETFAERVLTRAIRNGTAVVETGKVTKTDPKMLQELVERAHAAVLKPVSLRVPQGDIEIAKAIGKRKGIGYQTVLKEALHEGLRRSK